MFRILLPFVFVVVAGCATTGYDVSHYPREGVVGQATTGTVVALRPVNVRASETTTRAAMAVGGVAGAALGSKAGGRDWATRTAAAALGGLVGSVLAGAAAEALPTGSATEVVVEQSGRLTVVVQAGNHGLKVGDRVYVIASRGQTRVVRAN